MTEPVSASIERIAVLGAGTMGCGIAQLAAACGMSVTVYDIGEGALESGRAKILESLNHLANNFKISAQAHEQSLAALRFTTHLSTALAGAQLIIEAAPEELELKKSIFKEVSAMVAPNVILGTNTSSLSVTAIASAAQHPQRVLGMHFFNPPHVLKLLELVRAEQTSNETLECARQVALDLDRQLIVVSDSAGFATSRLGVCLGLEAMRMLEEGVANAADIDRAMEQGYRHPMGPLRVSDLVGLDVRLAIAEYLHQEIGEQFRPPQILRRLVRAGKLGKKTGEGFYRW